MISKGKIRLTGLLSEKKGTTYDAVIRFGKDWTDKNDNKHIGFDMEFDNKKPKK